MSVICPGCGAEFDIALFQFGRTVRCDCGELVDASAPKELPPGERARMRSARREVDELRRRADAVTTMILQSDVPRVDVQIAQNELREWVRREFPDRLDLFSRVYEARWRRLAEQGWERERPE
jgi:hypothetical protein